MGLACAALLARASDFPEFSPVTKLLLFLRTLERKAAVRAPDRHADASAAAHASMSTGPAHGAQDTALALRRSVQRAGGLLFAEHRTRCRARLPGVHAPGTLSSTVTSARCTRRSQERKADEVAVAVIDAALPVLSAEDVPAREIHMHIRTQARAVASAHIRAAALTRGPLTRGPPLLAQPASGRAPNSGPGSVPGASGAQPGQLAGAQRACTVLAHAYALLHQPDAGPSARPSGLPQAVVEDLEARPSGPAAAALDEAIALLLAPDPRTSHPALPAWCRERADALRSCLPQAATAGGLARVLRADFPEHNALAALNEAAARVRVRFARVLATQAPAEVASAYRDLNDATASASQPPPAAAGAAAKKPGAPARGPASNRTRSAAAAAAAAAAEHSNGAAHGPASGARAPGGAAAGAAAAGRPEGARRSPASTSTRATRATSGAAAAATSLISEARAGSKAGRAGEAGADGAARGGRPASPSARDAQPSQADDGQTVGPTPSGQGEAAPARPSAGAEGGRARRATAGAAASVGSARPGEGGAGAARASPEREADAGAARRGGPGAGGAAAPAPAGQAAASLSTPSFLQVRRLREAQASVPAGREEGAARPRRPGAASVLGYW